MSGRQRTGFTWQSTFAGGTVTHAENTWGGFTLRMVFPASALTTSGSRVRLYLQSTPSNSNTSIDKVYIGEKAAAGDAYDFSAAPTQVFFNGNAGFTFNGSNDIKVSDSTTFSLDETKNYVISVYMSTATGDYLGWVTDSSLTSNHFKLGDDASTTNATGYTTVTINRRYLLYRIEVS